MILILNNRDSFVFNLARYVEELGMPVRVEGSHDIDLKEIAILNPSAIIISPGPCTPNEAGISLEVIRELGPTTPVLGVCLGHQVIAQAYGWEVKKSNYPAHGRTTNITHDQTGLFSGAPTPLTVGLYHSLIASPVEGVSDLKIDATSTTGEVMALSHHQYPVYGVQFHPESILSQYGYGLMKNFLTLADARRQA